MPAPKKGADAKPHIVCFRLTESEKALLDEARGGMSPGEWARRFVVKGIQPQDNPFVELSIQQAWRNHPIRLIFTEEEMEDLQKGQRRTLEERIIRGEEGQ